MIFTERTITVVNDSATINKPLILYRGDKNIELKITIVESQFKFRSTGASNVIETANASYAQLVINTPYNSPIFSEVTATENGTVIFVISAAMIDEVREVGIYDIQIRLLDDSKQSRASIPPISNAIEIREPMAIEDGSPIDSNAVNSARVNRALTTTSAPLEVFDSQGNYIKNIWGDGVLITDAALNKMEAGIEGVNNKAKNIPTSLSQLTNDANFVNEAFVNDAIAGITGVSTVEPAALDMPKVFFYGNALPTTKDNVNLTMDYISNTAKFSSFVKLKCQGTSSMSYAKKNFTVSMFSDEARATKLKKDFKGWGAQSKFCLKANYVDTTHTRNLSGARIAYDMVNSRPDSPFKQQLLQCPRNGAVDGFPIKLYFNGEFYGIYTWNIPKDGWMFNMDKSNPNHVVLCAERNTDGNASLSNSCQFKKLWTDGDGGDWSVEFGTYSTDLQTKFNRVIAFVKDSTDEEFKANISQYLDLYSVLDYYCFSYLCCHLDGLAKNMLMVTYDGNIWGCSLYDMDSIFGVQWNGQSYVASNYQCPEQYQEQFSLLWPKIERCFGNELYQRYLELRRGALSLSNIIKHVEEIYDVIPDRVFADEKAKWTSLPQVNTNTMTRFRNYMRDRAAYVDAEMLAIGSNFPCTGIVLSADTLSFTTTDTQTLSVVVSPDNCTDTVTWSVSPTGIVSIDNGVITPVSNGTCTITATCGSYSDTCSVTVSLPSVECTGITLDKNTLALGIGTNVSDGNKNYLENATWELGTLNGDTTQYSLANSTADYRCQLTDLPVGTYTLHHDTYTYKKLGLNNNGIIIVGTSAKGAPNSSDITFNIINPNTTVDISVFPNGVTPITGVTLTRADISNIQEYSIEYTTVSTPSWAGSVDNNYLVIEFIVGSATDVDKNKLANICIGNDKYYISNPFITDTKLITTLSDKCYSSEYQNNVYVSIALPKSKYGSTLDEFKAYCSNNGITNIYINKDIQSTSGVLSAQLTATVTPSNCTQSVLWSVSPEGIVTVDNGLVTAVANGQATITATCGSYSDTCAVTVSGMSESGGESGENANYLANASWQDGTMNANNTGMTSSTDDKYTSIQIPTGKYMLTSTNATWKKYRLSNSEGNVLFYNSGANDANDLIIDTRVYDDTIFTLEISYYKPNDTIEVPSLILTTTESNITTLTLDGSLSYSIPDWPSNPSGENGQVNVEYIFSDIHALPTSYILKGYTHNNNIADASAKGLAKQYRVSLWNGKLYLSFTLDMAETGVTNDVESVTNYLSNNPLIFKYLM